MGSNMSSQRKPSKAIAELLNGQADSDKLLSSGRIERIDLYAHDFKVFDSLPSDVADCLKAGYEKALNREATDSKDNRVYLMDIVKFAIEDALSGKASEIKPVATRRKAVSIESVIAAQQEINAMTTCYEQGSFPTVAYNQRLLSANLFNECGISFKSLSDWQAIEGNKAIIDDINANLLRDAVRNKTISASSISNLESCGGLDVVLKADDLLNQIKVSHNVLFGRKADDNKQLLEKAIADKLITDDITKEIKSCGGIDALFESAKVLNQVKKAYGILRAKATSEVEMVNKVLASTGSTDLLPVYKVDVKDNQAIAVNLSEQQA